jgi:GT2 family glycosyltransferase
VTAIADVASAIPVDNCLGGFAASSEASSCARTMDRYIMVSVVIPTYNRAHLIGRALGSVAAQTRPAEEIIVVDDGSTDGTAEAVAKMAAGVRVLRQEHAGVSAARNRGIAAARGEWIAFLDSDDVWLPRKLERQVDFVGAHPGAEACQTDEIWMRNGVRVNPGRRHHKPSGDIFLASLDLCLVSPSAAMLRRETLARVGGFDAGLAACEDYDLWLRLSVDTPVHLVAEPLVIRYAGHADQLSGRHWGMDRFRVASLARLLAAASLTIERRRAVAAVLARKCEILTAGARRRGRVAEAARYEALARFGRACGATPSGACNPLAPPLAGAAAASPQIAAAPDAR